VQWNDKVRLGLQEIRTKIEGKDLTDPGVEQEIKNEFEVLQNQLRRELSEMNRVMQVEFTRHDG
jgi:hypothetical protein